MYQVIASDLDGTLLSPEHTLTPFARKVLKSLTENGLRFIFATGRHHVDVEGIRESLDIETFMITSNGARIHNKQGDLIAAHNIPETFVDDLIDLGRDLPKVQTHVYANDNWYVEDERVLEEEEEFFKDSEFMYEIVDFKTFDKSNVFKIFYTAKDPQELIGIEKQLNEKWADKVSIAYSAINCLEVMAQGVSKGAALVEVLKLKGFDLKECIAFGDGMNDFEMLSIVGKAHIMKNADIRLIERLPNVEIIGSNEDDAVVNRLVEYFSLT